MSSTLRAALSVSGLRSEWLIRHLPRSGVVTTRLPRGEKLRLWSRGDDWVSTQVFWRGWDGYEPGTVPLFYEYAHRSRLTLDVGAHVGYFAILAGLANPAGRVIAFEPFEPIHARLLRNVRLNQLGHVDCIAAAVGDQDGSAEFFYGDSTPMPSSSSLSAEFMQGTPDLQRRTVPVLTLDRYLGQRDLRGVDLVKLDTESTEPAALRGMRGILERDRPTVFCEVLLGRGAEESVDAIFRELGYSFYLLTPEGPLPRDVVKGDPVWLNYLFTPSPRDRAER